jgi:uncharacterized OB-fold protein
MTTEYKKPLPRPINTELSRPFWEGAKRGELMMPRCKKCDHIFFYPRRECPRCLSSDIGWVKVSGKGRLHSFTIVRQPANPAFRDDVPHAYSVIQLDEGPRMISNMVECDLDALEVDMPVVAVFDAVTPEWTLVKFKPA